ncbi:hypothetical protein MLD38_002659 [Melastoma candidum]|uniref:Uncharacterized protein n=1 Tax=Melastoma candidum TaxID=119954 RepID=A0ACB9S3U0_9MYRT|nr:hypothetical protein MLD38_002659 [Melastoma candidum]
MPGRRSGSDKSSSPAEVVGWSDGPLLQDLVGHGYSKSIDQSQKHQIYEGRNVVGADDSGCRDGVVAGDQISWNQLRVERRGHHKACSFLLLLTFGHLKP